ncbi:MAG: lytic murein transglycosylase [Thermoleophilia bacterium]|nr:lytic murein transglycosylase [Thermoleophilia bacterium]
MGRFRTALATISVGALLATGQAAFADGAQPITDAPHTTAPQADSTGGATPPKTTPSKTPDTDKQNPPAEDKKEKKPQSADPKTEEIDPGTDRPQSAEELAPSTAPTITMNPGAGLSGDGTPVAACDGSTGPPKNLIPIYIKAAGQYDLGERGPQILAAINKVETDFGRLNTVTSYAGAQGWMQFMPATWDMYGTDGDGDGKADPYNPKDAITSAARYLAAAGAPNDWYDAVWAYNHADWYVQDVLDKAACYGDLVDTVQVDEDLKVFVCKPDIVRTLEVPSYYMRAFEAASSRYELGQRGVWALAAVARLESDYGRGMTRKQMRDTGAMGLSREEWQKFGVDGNDDGYVQRDEPWDAVSTFARMLWSKPSIEEGLFEHNHASWYVEAAMREAAQIAGECDTVKSTWNIAFPAPTTNATDINWDNLVILNAAAQNDIQSGQIDSRVINLLAMLTQKYSLTISALKSDHSLTTASGNISNHSGGRAMDIASVNGVSCTDQSAESPCTEVGLFLASLPDGVKPDELIYGWDLDGAGPAFALADHENHIHAGFGL